MELYQVRYFLAVADALNFTRAAEKCFVSQSSLTKAIQKLEDTLGGRLFDRTKSSVQLTELGRIMHPHFQQLYHTAETAQKEARDAVTTKRTELRLGIMCSIGLHVQHRTAQADRRHRRIPRAEPKY